MVSLGQRLLKQSYETRASLATINEKGIVVTEFFHDVVRVHVHTRC